MPRSSWRGRPLGLAALILAGAAQAPHYRVAYDLRVQRGGVPPDEVAAGRVSGPAETAVRLALGTDSVEVEALVVAEPAGGGDSVALTGDFVTRRRLGRSRRGLPLWELDVYRRTVRLAWGDTARIHPFGGARRDADGSLWVEVVVTRGPASGDIRPQETVTPGRDGVEVALAAVLRPRRARVALALVRNDSVSAPRGLDLIPDGPARRLDLVVGRGPARSFELSLASPERARGERDRALVLDADVVCLSVNVVGVSGPASVVCGRINNVARRLPLPTGDTLVATFAWPGPR